MSKTILGLRRAAVLAVLLLPVPAFAAPIAATLYKNPQCNCCDDYAAYLDRNGFRVEVKTTSRLQAINREAGVPEALDGCHAMFVGGYVVQGHVPVDVLERLLAERPNIVGISIPGMPKGVPGMDGPRADPLAVYEIAPGAAQPRVFAMVP